MTLDELVESVCVSINDFLQTTRTRIKNLIPSSVTHIISKHQWEFTIRYKELTTSTSEEWVVLPDNFDKEIALWRPGYTEPLDYISPREYARMKALSSTPYGARAVRYTIMGGESLKQKRIHFLDPPSKAMIIKMLYSMKVDPVAVQALPDEFVPVVKSHIIYQMTPPLLRIGGILQPNPSFVVARDDYRSNLSELISREQGQRGRLTKMILSETDRRAYQFYHK